MPTIAELKANHDTVIRQEVATGGISPDDVADQLDNLADKIGEFENVELALVDGATVTWDYLLGNVARVTIAGDRTIDVTNVTNGQAGLLIIKQDAVGGRVPVLPGNVETGMAFSGGGNETDVLGFVYSNGSFFWSIANFGTASGGLDSDAQAYITAAGISNTTHKNAVDAFVSGLKTNGLWTKCLAYYPLYGTAIGSVKWNLKNPADTDGAFRLTPVGTFTYAAGGVTLTSNALGDGLNTHLAPNNSGLTQNSVCFGVSVKTNTDELKGDMGASQGAGDAAYILSKTGGNFGAANNSAGDLTIVANASAIGRYDNSRTGATLWRVYKNGVQIGTDRTTASAAPVSTPFLICNAGTTLTSTKQISAAWVFIGLSSAEVSTLDGLRATFETAIGH